MTNPTQSRLINEVIANSRPVADRSAYNAAMVVYRAAHARHIAAAVEFRYDRITGAEYRKALVELNEADRAVDAAVAAMSRV